MSKFWTKGGAKRRGFLPILLSSYIADFPLSSVVAPGHTSIVWFKAFTLLYTQGSDPLGASKASFLVHSRFFFCYTLKLLLQHRKGSHLARASRCTSRYIFMVHLLLEPRGSHLAIASSFFSKKARSPTHVPITKRTSHYMLDKTTSFFI